MPHGYSKLTDSRSKCKYKKRHKNGEETVIDIEEIPGSEKWFAFIEDAGRTKELGRFNTKGEAKRAAKNFMRNNPKGLQSSGFGGGGFLPGMDGAQSSNDFWG